jgi:hypothetical protein
MTYDYYKLLGIPRTASLADIKRAYRSAAKKYHPDKNPEDEGAEEFFVVLTNGYDVLTNPRKKVRYDILLELEYRAEKEFDNPYAKKVSTKRRHRYSNTEILKRKQRLFEIQRRKDLRQVLQFRKRNQTFPLVYRYSMTSLIILSGIVMGYKNWFVNYNDTLNFFSLCLSFLVIMAGIFYLSNLAYTHLFVLFVTKKIKRNYEKSTYYLMTLLIVVSAILFATSVKLKKHYELNRNADYTFPTMVILRANTVEYEFKVDGNTFLKRSNELDDGSFGNRSTRDCVVKYSKSNPRISELIFLDQEFPSPTSSEQ